MDIQVADDENDILESSLVGEALRRRNQNNESPSKRTREQRLLDDEIADIFEDDGAKESKSMVVEAAAGVDVSEAARKRKSNSLRLGTNYNNMEERKQSLPNRQEPIQVGGYSNEYGKADRVQDVRDGGGRERPRPAREAMAMGKNNGGSTEERPDSHTTKMYENGTYHPDNNNTGYKGDGKKKNGSNVLEVSSDNPLSQSLPSWGMNALKADEHCVSN